jgi:4-amino-4-deoxy-L-arabinose transferase-like glycosyltransferase
MRRAKKNPTDRQSGGDSVTRNRAPRVRLWPIAVAFAVFALIFGALTITSSLKQSPTFDEPIHLLGGYSYLKWNDYRINPEHPPLVKLWAALPLVWMEINDPRPYTPYWALILKAEPGGPFYPLIQEMFFARNEAESLFFPAKLQMILLSMVLGLFVCLWSYQLYGVKAAIAALFLYGLDPNILAHSSIIHSDLPFALFFFLSCYFFWRVWNRFSWTNAILAILAVALAAITKHSFVAIFLVWAVLGVITLCRSATELSKRVGSEWLSSRNGKLLFLAGLFASAALASYFAIWAAYGFRFNAVPNADRALYMTQISPPHGPMVESIRAFFLEHRLLPEAMIAGYSYNLKIWKHGAYLLGEISEDGFWSYFFVAFAVKTPAPVLLLLAALTIHWLRRRERPEVNYWLVLPALIYFALAVFSRFNLGIRHLLPVYPFLFVLLAGGAAALWRGGTRPIRLGLIVLGLWSVGSSLASFPHYLSYFNELVGGPKQGHKILLDSNLDWGQDLKALKRWMDERHVRGIQLLYFGVGYPKYYGIDDLHGRDNVERRSFPPGENLELPEHFAVSASYFYADELYLPKEMKDLLRSYKLGQPVATIGHSILVFKIDRTSQAYNNAAFIMARKGGLAAAANLYRQALRIDARQRFSHFGLAHVLALQNDFAEATRHYQAALEIDPNFAEAHESLARLLAAQGNKEQALRHYQEALRLMKERGVAR